MAKKNYLSRKEQEAWEYLSGKEIIDNELLVMIFPDMSQASRNKILHNLYKKGRLKKACRDIYYNPSTLSSYQKLALKISPGYIGLLSALKHHGLSEYEDFTIFIITEKKYKETSIENYEFRYIPLREHYSGFTESRGIMVSTVEKTLFDCFLKIRYLSYSTLTKAIYEAENINWPIFLSYFEKAPQSLSQKAGYILFLMKKETGIKVPEKALINLRAKAKHPVKLGNGKKTLYNPEWKVQDSIGKKNILSWWH